MLLLEWKSSAYDTETGQHACEQFPCQRKAKIKKSINWTSWNKISAFQKILTKTTVYQRWEGNTIQMSDREPVSGFYKGQSLERKLVQW